MFNRRDFLSRALGGTSLLAVGSVVPEFLANTAVAANRVEKPRDTILVVVELSGGNDGLNTLAPYADDLYQKARPTLAITRKDVLKIDDYHGLHPSMTALKGLYDQKKLAVVQGVGYPNPDRSHFESMDIWQLADPRRAQTSGWLARTIPGMSTKEAGVPGMYIGQERLPLALQGADGGVISLADRESFRLQLSGNAAPRKKLIEDLNADDGNAELAAFVRKRQLQTYTSLQKIEEALKDFGNQPQPGQPIPQPVGGPRRGGNQDETDLKTLTGKLNLISKLIQKGLGTRIYYASTGGFDTHSGQADTHDALLGDVSGAISRFFDTLAGEHGGRVVLITYSEFGRRVKENGSRGTDHGAASCMFVAGPKVVGGLVGKHPKLDDLTDGDLRYGIDFRSVYGALLDDWLGVDSRGVLGEKQPPLPAPLVDLDKKVEPNPAVPGGPKPTAPGTPIPSKN
ncbi:MAG TPA: DUF1501 domain-containing protein [Gemmataceae bacterium]|nr:DUF1501 domain-containing protein [Gemmataceae bacterium]